MIKFAIIEGTIKMDKASFQIDVDLVQAFNVVELYEKRYGKPPKWLKLHIKEPEGEGMELFGIPLEILE